jgi:hypothetical protein
MRDRKHSAQITPQFQENAQQSNRIRASRNSHSNAIPRMDQGMLAYIFVYVVEQSAS